MKFIDKLLSAGRRNKSLLCIGLDPDVTLMPKVDLLEFNKAIVDATADLACAYKPNLAFYEALGIDGLKVLQKTIEHIPDHIPVIGDGKRGDIGNTAKPMPKPFLRPLALMPLQLALTWVMTRLNRSSDMKIKVFLSCAGPLTPARQISRAWSMPRAGRCMRQWLVKPRIGIHVEILAW